MPEIESGAKIAAAREVRGVLSVGTRLRSYELTGVLGQGSFGITYRARDAILHREVAIKEYLPITLALREDGTRVVPRSSELAEEFVSGRERFLDEARTLARLDRAPAIVRVLDFLEANGTAYMVMALVAGETLDQRLVRAGPLSAREIDSLLQPLLYGLEEVHAAGFLHRDIKPANVIIDFQGKPTLIDFGAARAAMVGGSSALTAIFTPGYAAPEQFTSARQGPWTDIYGLSATLYHAITGDVPPNSVDRILRDTYRPLGGIRPKDFPAELLSGIDAGLAIRADDRPQSIAAWRQAFSRVAARGPSDAATAIMPRRHVAEKDLPPARSAARRRALLRTGVVALLLMLAGASYYAIVERPTSVSSAVQTLTAEQLELALIERRKADLLAAEKKRLEEEAQLRAEAEAEAKRQADADLEKARQQRQKAEEELAAFKAIIEARRQAGAGQREQAAAVQQVAAEEAAQRKAEMEMMSLRQAEEEAQRKAIADAEAKRQADAALAKAQAERRRADEEARQKAEAEATRRKADEDARQKAEAEAAKRRADEEARQKAEAEATKRKADEEARQKAEAEAAKRRADEEARQNAEIAAAKRKADEEMRRAAELEAKRRTEAAANEKVQAEAKARAEAAELALRLPAAERQRLQMALTSLGFDTRGNDGAFGPRSREMIAAWQKARNLPVTGYLDGAQHQTLLREAAPAVAKYDLEQKKAEDEKRKMEEEKRKAEEEAKVRAVAALNAVSFDGPWKRDRTARCENAPDNISFNGLTVRDGKFSYTSVGEHHRETCSVQVNSDGSFRNDTCLLQMRGRFAGDQLQLFYHSPSYGQCEVSARRGE